MRRIVSVFCAFFLVVCIGCSASDAGGPVPRQAPDTRFVLLDGRYLPLEAYRGRVVAVVFWGSWCGRSKRTLADLNEFAAEVSASTFSVVAVSLDRASDEEDVLSALRERQLNHIQVAYSGNEGLDESYLSFQAEDVPHIFIVNEQGQIVRKGRSADDVEDYLEERGLLE